jgi:hypothetical protein
MKNAQTDMGPYEGRRDVGEQAVGPARGRKAPNAANVRSGMPKMKGC